MFQKYPRDNNEYDIANAEKVVLENTDYLSVPTRSDVNFINRAEAQEALEMCRYEYDMEATGDDKKPSRPKFRKRNGQNIEKENYTEKSRYTFWEEVLEKMDELEIE